MAGSADGRTPRQRPRSTIAAARAYTPRGRTVRDLSPEERATLHRSAAGEPAGRTAAARAADPGRRGGRTRNTTTAGRTAGGSGRGRTTRTSRAPARRVARTRPAVRRRVRAPRLADPRRRLRLATTLAMAMFAALGIRLVELQLTDGPAYAASGLENRLQTVELPAPRGAIVDRNGTVLAHSVEARYVFADPALVKDPQATAEQLAPLLGVPAYELVEKMQPRLLPDGRPSRFEWLARGVDIATAERVAALDLPGIGVERDEQRHVPGGDLAANLIGFTGADMAGLEGLEAAFDEELRGIPGRRTYEAGQGGSLAREIPGGYRVETAARPGSQLRLTIDADLQYEVQQILAEHMTAAGAHFAAAVVLDVKTGEVLAQASFPGYDATDPLSVPAERRVDAASALVFDPGSVHKALVLAAALEEGVITPDEVLVVDPTIQKGDVTFADTTWHPPGTRMSLPAIMAFSSNVGTIRIADRLGPQRLYEYQQAFGLGSPTGSGMPGEAAGALLPPEEWSGSSYGSVPIGHSVTTTTLQLAAAYAVIAGDGTWRTPTLVQAVVDPDGRERRPVPVETRRVVSPETAAAVRTILEAPVTVPGATGTAAAVDGYRVAGKTGTGGLVMDGRYAEGQVATFVGMAPAEAPRFVIAVAAYVPSGGGGLVAAPTFGDMMASTLARYRVPPSDEPAPAFTLYP